MKKTGPGAKQNLEYSGDTPQISPWTSKKAFAEKNTKLGNTGQKKIQNAAENAQMNKF